MAVDERVMAAATALAAEGAVDGLFLAGSHGRGAADEWSDVDFVALAAEDERAAILEAWQAALEARLTLVYWKAFPFGLANAITADWLRVDLYVTTPARFGGRSKANLRPVHDPGEVWNGLPDALPPAMPQAATVERLTLEFLRVLGLMPVALGREEWVLLVRGAGILLNSLVELMVETSPEPDRGGALHPSRLLTAEQAAALEALPYPGPVRDEVVAAHVALAAAFLPLARQLYAETGQDWPAAFETATRAHLARAGVALD
ncbi:MAG: nucleotidyltransferase domain-containing protein [Pseudomonadota bacterium]